MARTVVPQVVIAVSRVEFLTERLALLRGKRRDAVKAGRSPDAIDRRIVRRNDQLIAARAKAKLAKAGKLAAKAPAKVETKPARKVAAKAPAKVETKRSRKAA